MKANEIIQKFEESLKSISRKELLNLFEEIDAMEQDNQLSMEEYFTKINNESIFIQGSISIKNSSFSYNFDCKNNQAQTFDNKNIPLAA